MKEAQWAVTCPVCGYKPIQFQAIDNYDPDKPPILQGDLDAEFPAPCPICKDVRTFKRKDFFGGCCKR